MPTKTCQKQGQKFLWEVSFLESFRIAVPGAGPEDGGGSTPPSTALQSLPSQEPELHREAKCRRDLILRGYLLASA